MSHCTDLPGPPQRRNAEAGAQSGRPRRGGSEEWQRRVWPGARGGWPGADAAAPLPRCPQSRPSPRRWCHQQHLLQTSCAPTPASWSHGQCRSPSPHHHSWECELLRHCRSPFLLHLGGCHMLSHRSPSPHHLGGCQLPYPMERQLLQLHQKPSSHLPRELFQPLPPQEQNRPKGRRPPRPCRVHQRGGRPVPQTSRQQQQQLRRSSSSCRHRMA